MACFKEGKEHDTEDGKDKEGHHMGECADTGIAVQKADAGRKGPCVQEVRHRIFRRDKRENVCQDVAVVFLPADRKELAEDCKLVFRKRPALHERGPEKNKHRKEKKEAREEHVSEVRTHGCLVWTVKKKG